MTAKPPDPLDGTASAAELGEWIGLSEPRIHALAREGVIPRTGKSRFDLKAAVRAYADHMRAGQLGRISSNPDLNAEKLRLARANAEKVELANEKVRGLLVPVAEVEAAWSSVLRDVRAAMLAIPARIQQRLGHITPYDVQMIDREIRASLSETSREE